MANVTPDQIFPNLTADVSGFTIPYTDVPAISEALANPSTGDVRALIKGIIEAAYNAHEALTTESQSTKMILAKSVPSSVGATIDVFRQRYTADFNVVVDQNSSNITLEAE